MARVAHLALIGFKGCRGLKSVVMKRNPTIKRPNSERDSLPYVLHIPIRRESDFPLTAAKLYSVGAISESRPVNTCRLGRADMMNNVKYEHEFGKLNAFKNSLRVAKPNAFETSGRPKTAARPYCAVALAF